MTTLRLLCLIGVGLLLAAARPDAACSGSGLTWTCTSNLTGGATTPSQINTAMASATDGATFTFDAGAYSWGGTAIQPPSAKSITLICASQGACDVSYTGGFPGVFAPVVCLNGGTTTKVYRVSGFDFTASGGGDWFACNEKIAETEFTVRFDHNTWVLGTNNTLVHTAITNAVVHIYGVFDNNVITGVEASDPLFYYAISEDTTPLSGRLGSRFNLFVEDTTITFAQGSGGVDKLCSDGWGSMGFVARFSTWTNCRLAMHGAAHSMGPSNIEAYGNTVICENDAYFTDCFRAFHHQGSGTWAVFLNTLQTFAATSSGAGIQTQHYRSFQNVGGTDPGLCDGFKAWDGNRAPTNTYRGYPCKHQPGRDWNGTLVPNFGFLNTGNGGVKIDLTRDGGQYTGPAYMDPPWANLDWSLEHLVANRDFYTGVSLSDNSCTGHNPNTGCTPFNGTVGIGQGPLAERPSTCTPTPEAADAGSGGVMYWAKDVGVWKRRQATAAGLLYRCSATNTWTPFYVPYTYPHALIGGDGTPDAPSGARVS